MKESISVVLPAYNEAENIEKVVRDIWRFLERNFSDFEIIVVDDGSVDETHRILSALQREKGDALHIIKHQRNRGYGAALRSGLFSAEKDLVFYTDADGQFDIENLKSFVEKIKECDLVIGWRIKRQDLFLRKFYSFCYNKLIFLLFGLKVKDIDCSFKLFRNSALKKLSIERDDFFVDTELLLKAKHLRLRFKEEGVRHLRRQGGKSTVKFSHIFVTLKDIIYFHGRFKDGIS